MEQEIQKLGEPVETDKDADCSDKGKEKRQYLKKENYSTTKNKIRQRSQTVGSPKPSKIKIQTGSVRKPVKKWRPPPAHSGVPVPEKMKKLSLKLLDVKFYNNEQE